MQKRGVLRNAYYLQDVVPSVQLIYVARLYGVLPCSAYLRLTCQYLKENKNIYRVISYSTTVIGKCFQNISGKLNWDRFTVNTTRNRRL